MHSTETVERDETVFIGHRSSKRTFGFVLIRRANYANSQIDDEKNTILLFRVLAINSNQETTVRTKQRSGVSPLVVALLIQVIQAFCNEEKECLKRNISRGQGAFDNVNVFMKWYFAYSYEKENNECT